MKTLLGLLLVVALAAPGYAAESAPRPGSEPAKQDSALFEKLRADQDARKEKWQAEEAARFTRRKTDELQRLDRRIADQQADLDRMQAERACIQAATDQDRLRECESDARRSRWQERAPGREAPREKP